MMMCVCIKYLLTDTAIQKTVRNANQNLAFTKYLIVNAMLVHIAVINCILLLAQSFINHQQTLKTGSLLSSYSPLLKMASPLKSYKDNLESLTNALIVSVNKSENYLMKIQKNYKTQLKLIRLIAKTKKIINTSTKKHQIIKADQIKLRHQLLQQLNKKAQSLLKLLAKLREKQLSLLLKIILKLPLK